MAAFFHTRRTLPNLSQAHVLLVCTSAFRWPFSSVWPATLCHTLTPGTLCVFALSHSLLSKCWHISFNCGVFISHSLSLSSILSPLFLWGNAECVFKGSIPRQPPHRFSSSYLFSPRSFSSSSNCLIPLLLSAIRCQRAFKQLPKGSVPQPALWFFFLFFFSPGRGTVLGCSVEHCCGQVSLFFQKLFWWLLFELVFTTADRISIKRCIICITSTSVPQGGGTWYI